MSTSTEYFEKGSLIALEDGQCKKIEDLKKEDFLLVSLYQKRWSWLSFLNLLFKKWLFIHYKGDSIPIC